MKILHTADWHLGINTFGRNRLDEQKHVLDEIVSIANFENIDVVLIAGDIFCQKMPSAESEKVFFEYAEKLSLSGERLVFVLAGNHDDKTRIGKNNKLFTKSGIIPLCDFEPISADMFPKETTVDVIETGSGYVKLQKGSEIVTLAYLPYFDADEGGYKEFIKNKIQTATMGFDEKSTHIFASHMFVCGAKPNNNKPVNTQMQIPVDLIPDCDYVALGHIHNHQQLAKNINYSGSIIKLSPSNVKTGVNIIEISNKVVSSVNFIPLANPYRYEKVSAQNVDDAIYRLDDFDDNDLVELDIAQRNINDDIKKLKSKYKCICHISLDDNIEEENMGAIKSFKHLSNEKLFETFYREVSGEQPTKEITNLFLSAKGEEDETN